MEPVSSWQSGLAEAASRCVRCGLCLPGCPSYRLLRNEAHSPRGRVALAQLIATASELPGPEALATLDTCLGCGHCAAICPSGVPFLDILDQSRARVLAQPAATHLRLRRRLGLRLLRGGGWVDWLTAIGRALGRWTRLRDWARGPAGWQTMLELAALGTWPQPRPRALGRPTRMTVALFPGCGSASYEAAAMQAASTVLQRLGYGVWIPESAVCCGIAHQHEGFPEIQERLGARQRQLLTVPQCAAVLSLSSSCCLGLRQQLAGQRPVWTLEELLAQDQALTGLPLDPPAKLRIAVHEPCSQRHVLRPAATVRDLLRDCERIEWVELAEAETCCGAAGLFTLKQPQLSEQLRARKTRVLRRAGAPLVLSANLGCRLQLRLAARELDPPPEILHPVEFLARLLCNHP